jgi:hypothetical protein
VAPPEVAEAVVVRAVVAAEGAIPVAVAAEAEARAVEVVVVRVAAARVEDKAVAGIGSSPEPASTMRSPASPVVPAALAVLLPLAQSDV